MPAPGNPTTPHLDAATWLHELYGAAEDGWLTIFTLDRDTGHPTTDWAPVADLDALASIAARREPHSCTWFGVATRHQRLTGGARGGARDCAALPGLWVDIDIAGPGHRSGGRLARDRDHAHALVDDFPLPPTAVIDSGGGLQAWWLFAEMADVDDKTTRLLTAWGATWNRLADARGIDLDNVFDVPRVMRLPGTTNRKEDLARPVTATSVDFGRRYGLDDIDTYCDEPPPPPAHRAGSRTPYIGPERPGDAYSLRHTGGDILVRHGFTLARTDRNGDEHWVRPGKEAREGTSATVYREDGHTTIWSSTVASQWPAVAVNRPYDPFGLYAALEHGGRFDDATRALRLAGYGSTHDGVSDLLPAGSTTTAATTPTAPPAPWPTPSPLPPPEPGPAFPLHTLPAWAQAHADAVADQVQVPVDLAAMQIIGALSAACTGRANVHVSPNWSEPVNLYLAVAMRSGAGKSPSDKLVVDWLRTWQRDRMEQMADAHAKAALKVRHARKRLAKLEGSEAVDDHELFKAYEALAMAENDVPPLPRLLADDTSPEAVAGLLREHGQRLAILSTEADLFDMLLRGKPGQRANMNLFLKAWSGDSFTRDRKGGSESGPEWTELSRPLLTIACSVQPSVLAQVRNDPEMTNRGLAARFMVSVPDDVIGHRDVTRRFTATRLPTTDPYETEATRLATRWCTWSNPANLHFTPAASDALCTFLAEIEPRLAKGADLEHLAEWANKLHGSIARYAGLLHLAENGDPQANIEADTVARAIELGRYWMAHAAVVETLTDERAIDRAEGLLAWIAEQGAGAVTLADMQAGHRRPGEGLNKIADYIAPVELLIDLGYLRPVDNGDWRSEVGIRRAKSPNFAVWPEIIGKPRSAVIPRSPRTASMGERDLSSSPYTPPPSLEPRGTRITRTTDETSVPVDNPPADQRPDVGGSSDPPDLTADDCLFLDPASATTPTTVPTDQD